jgi:hypothetical protein
MSATRTFALAAVAALTFGALLRALQRGQTPAEPQAAHPPPLHTWEGEGGGLPDGGPGVPVTPAERAERVKRAHKSERAAERDAEATAQGRDL